MNRPRAPRHHTNSANPRVQSQELDRLAFYCFLLATEVLEGDIRKGLDDVIAEVRAAQDVGP